MGSLFSSLKKIVRETVLNQIPQWLETYIPTNSIIMIPFNSNEIPFKTYNRI